MKINLQRVLECLKVYGNNGKISDIQGLASCECCLIYLEYESKIGNKTSITIRIYENNVDEK